MHILGTLLLPVLQLLLSSANEGMGAINLSPLCLSSLSFFLFLPVFAKHWKNTYRKFEEKNIPRKEIARPQCQFPHSCVCERFILTHDRSAYSAAGKYVDRSWEYTNRPQSQTHECGNWDWGRAIHFLGIRKWFSLQSIVQHVELHIIVRAQSF